MGISTLLSSANHSNCTVSYQVDAVRPVAVGQNETTLHVRFADYLLNWLTGSLALMVLRCAAALIQRVYLALW